MRRLINCLVFILLAISLTGCEDPFIVGINYAPSSLFVGTGDIKVGEFRYVPAEDGKVRDNQLADSDPIMTILTSEKVAEYYKNAILSEFKSSGFSVGKGSIIVNGVITNFYSDLGWGRNFDWELAVTFYINREGDPKPVYEKSVKINLSEHRRSDLDQVISKLIRLSYEELVKDEQVMKIVQNQ